MAKWIIKWNSGWGENAEVVEAETEQKAREAAYEAAREEFENNADYGADPYTKENAVDLGIEDDADPDNPDQEYADRVAFSSHRR